MADVGVGIGGNHSEVRLATMLDVRNFNARGDGVSDDTRAVQQALDTGKIVSFAPGVYLCGTLYLRSGGGIHLGNGAVLRASPDCRLYNRDDFSPRNQVSRREHASGAHFIIAENCENITFSGHGRIDGNFQAVFDMTEIDPKGRPHYPYPQWRMGQMIFLCNCRNVTIKDLTIGGAHYWNCFLLNCEDVVISGVRIRADRLVMNADGFDIDCCRRVLIEGCDIDCGDDCIAVRGNEVPVGRAAPCEEVMVRHCRLRSPACGVRVGVGNGTIRNCTFSELEMVDCSIGIGLCPSYTPGKCVKMENILFENIQCEGKQAFLMLPYWGGVGDVDDPAIQPVKGITLRNFTAVSRRPSLIAAPVCKGIFSNFSLENVKIQLIGTPEPLSATRWPFQNMGILNLYRFPELELRNFHGEAEAELPVVLRGGRAR